MKLMLSISIVCMLGGCTHSELKQNTRAVAATLDALQRQQVLDNIAMFVGDPSALPAHVRLKNGTVQVADQITPSFSIMVPPVVRVTETAGLSGQRQWTQNWTVVPVTDAGDLARLRALYRRLVGATSAEQFEIEYMVPEQPNISTTTVTTKSTPTTGPTTISKVETYSLTIVPSPKAPAEGSFFSTTPKW